MPCPDTIDETALIERHHASMRRLAALDRRLKAFCGQRRASSELPAMFKAYDNLWDAARQSQGRPFIRIGDIFIACAVGDARELDSASFAVIRDAPDGLRIEGFGHVSDLRHGARRPDHNPEEKIS